MKWERSQMKCAVLKRKKMMMGGRKGEWWSKRFCVTLHGDDDDDWQGKRGTHAYSRDTERDRQRYRERNTDRQTVREREREREKGGKKFENLCGHCCCCCCCCYCKWFRGSGARFWPFGGVHACVRNETCMHLLSLSLALSLSLLCDRRARKHLPLCYIIILHESLLSKHP